MVGFQLPLSSTTKTISFYRPTSCPCKQLHLTHFDFLDQTGINYLEHQETGWLCFERSIPTRSPSYAEFFAHVCPPTYALCKKLEEQNSLFYRRSFSLSQSNFHKLNCHLFLCDSLDFIFKMSCTTLLWFRSAMNF